MNEEVHITTSSNVRTLILCNILQVISFHIWYVICSVCDSIVRHKGISVFYQEQELIAVEQLIRVSVTLIPRHFLLDHTKNFILKSSKMTLLIPSTVEFRVAESVYNLAPDANILSYLNNDDSSS